MIYFVWKESGHVSRESTKEKALDALNQYRQEGEIPDIIIEGNELKPVLEDYPKVVDFRQAKRI